ncbi:MAG: glutamyl-tRNA reductase [candidate division Zixibacteria bacterium]|nr:glutamyl-tRNA reductase [candidate division Zixibacteria bacterium]
MLPCNWRLLLCGINHTTASLEQREPLQLSRDELAPANAAIFKQNGLKEAIVVSTCNRIEFYLIAELHREAFEIVAEFYQNSKQIDILPLKEQFYIKKDKHVVDHLFRVTSGIDSMVLGENQIMGQGKEAYSASCAAKSAGKIIHRLFHQAFRIGKQVRTNTELGKGACSVASATIDLLRTKIKAIENPTILFIGLNKMITLAVSRLNRYGYNNFIFANRTREKAVEFGQQYHVDGFGLDNLADLLSQADVVVSCTGADEAIIDDNLISKALSLNENKQLLIADMAVPRDVDIKQDYPGLEIYDLEAVQEFVKEKQAKRRDAIPQAERIIEYKLEQFVYWYDSVRHEPAYNDLGEAYERTREHEMKKIMPMLDEDSRELVDRATKRLINKLLHIKNRSQSKAEQTE